MKLRTGIVAVVLMLAMTAGAQGRGEAAAMIKIGGQMAEMLCFFMPLAYTL